MTTVKLLLKTRSAMMMLFVFAIAPLAPAQNNIMLLGDSNTRGVDGPSTDDAGYRNDLAGILVNEGIDFNFIGSMSDGVGFDAHHEGNDGFKADQIANNMGQYLGQNPRIIVLHIGTNDLSNGESAGSTRDDVETILDAINSFDPSIKVVVSSLLPRTDAGDTQTDSFNELLEELFYKKRDEQGFNIFYAGLNEIIKQNPAWATAYFDSSDPVHPTDDGYAVMAAVYFDVLTTAINAPDENVTDNFERTDLGGNWDADPEFILQGGDLVNSATTGAGNWEYMATFLGTKNPSSVGVTWADDADVLGLDQGGLALLLDAPSQNASGYLAWISPSDNELRLWTITNGSAGADLLTANPTNITAAPGPGSAFRVDMTVGVTELQFDYFVNNQFAGTITVPNPGLAGELYSGVLLRHDRHNDVAEFVVSKTGDVTAPDAVSDLAVGTPQATSVPLTWTSTGDDGQIGVASQFDIRYSTDVIAAGNFAAAAQVGNPPNPELAGTVQSMTVSGLQPGTTHYFAMKVIDDHGNTSGISNVVSATTEAANIFVDNFNRTTGLGANWSADSYDIVQNRLSNAAGDGAWDDIAVLNARKNPIEVSFEFGPNADIDGLDQAGFVVVFGSASTSSDGYAITRRTAANEIRLWRLVAGELVSVIDKNQSPALGAPQPGDAVKVVISSDAFSNRFDFYINDLLDGQVEDTGFEHDLSQDNWTGVTLRSSLNNDIDNFSVLMELGAPATLSKVSGDAQVDTVAQLLDFPVVVRVADENGSPVPGVNVDFEVSAGGGSVDVTAPSGDIVIEAESGVLTAPMAKEADAAASNGEFIHVPDGNGDNSGGAAEYMLNIDQGGEYVIWGRAIYPNASSDVFRVVVGGDTSVWDVGQRQHESDWHWDQVSARGTGKARSPQFDPAVFTLTSGVHTIKLLGSKDGTKLDQLVVAAVGSGFEPPANQDPITPSGLFTDSNGEASVRWSLGTIAGSNALRVFATSLPELICTANALPARVDSIEKISGDNLSGTPGQPLSQPFVVQLRDRFGNPTPDVNMDFTLLPPSNGSLSVENTMSDGLGGASSLLTLATNTSANQIQVTADGYTGADVIFTSTAEVGAPDRIQIVAGNNQTGSAARALAAPVQVQVVDANNFGITDFSVVFSVASGGGNIDGSAQQTVVTNSAGIAEITPVLGPDPGTVNEFLATAEGLTNSPLSLVANSAAPEEVQALSPPVQTGVASLPLSDSVAVKVLDELGGALAGYEVTFAVTAGSGLINKRSSVTITTGTDGVARGEWRMGPDAGANRLRATSVYQGTGLNNSPLDFTANTTAGPAENIAIISGNNQSGLIGQPLAAPFVVSVTGNGNVPVANWPVYFLVTDGGGAVNPDTTYTDDNGRAQATLTLGNSPGANNNRVTATAPQSGSVNFVASGNTTTASTLTLVSGGNQSPARAGTALPEQIQVKVTDDDGNAVEGLSVTFRINTGGGSINGKAPQDTVTSIESDSNGFATVTWYLGGTVGPNNQRLDVSALNGSGHLNGSPITVSATALPGLPDPDASGILSDKTQVDANGRDHATITITVRDKFGNPVSGQAVTILSNGTDIISQPDDTTGLDGRAIGTIASLNPGEREIASRVNGSVDLTATVNLLFTDPNPVALSSFSLNYKGFAGVEIVWQTGREVGNVGFDVLRSLNAENSFEKINTELIPSSLTHDYKFVDNSIEVGRTYYYKLEDIAVNGAREQHGPISVFITVPEDFVLNQNYPNPFNPSTTITFALPEPTEVKVAIYNLQGQLVTTLTSGPMQAGHHQIVWSGKDTNGLPVSSGTYLYRIQAGEFVLTRRLLLLK